MKEAFSAEDVDKIKKKMKRYDVNGDGTLEKSEVKALLRKGNPEISDFQIDMLFQKVDKNRNGRLELNEFVEFCFQATAEQEKKVSRQRSPSPTIRPISRSPRPTFMKHSHASEASGLDWECVAETYGKYCGRNGQMEASEFMKLCRDCDLFGDAICEGEDETEVHEGFHPCHVDVLFKQLAGDHHMGKDEFCDAIVTIAARRKMPAKHLRGQIAAVQDPTYHATRSLPTRFHDDHVKKPSKERH